MPLFFQDAPKVPVLKKSPSIPRDQILHPLYVPVRFRKRKARGIIHIIYSRVPVILNPLFFFLFSVYFECEKP